ncbi:hypothetical protein E0H93_37010 [Rhizobium leguminosarum bv. viciae]|uniref:hypothetical protein n=1 Tax=Rhizobium leguminosarum TaxID=384 RepID=UPI001039C904|nr:hypothetical protein [Rhizobium leguminosarum]TBY17674.1 hypothetical protein E0H55_37755 [Rhizobium leguminosarum bv. viciae]TCA92475.1 hypothetical protein E0H93_37010 [Rhizobium leguminosarum bv. viciae]
MFNLLMFNVDWASGRATIPLGRMFEYTEKHIAEQFRQDGAILFDQLITLPCLFCEEGTDNEVAYVGQVNRYRITGGELAIEISFDQDVPLLQNTLLYANRYQVDMPHDFEFSRNHWAVKEIDLYRFLLRNIRPRRQRPTVFQLAEHENIEPTLVSVMMPYAGSFTAVFESIRQAAATIGLRCRRADEIWENPAVIQDVVALIDRSRVVICDCTGRNPNVFYEAGIAHTLGREVILLSQSEQDIPFDLRHLRFLPYVDTLEGRARLSQQLAEKMQAILGH